MKIEAVTVSVGYGDFLATTLPQMLHSFDRLVVVTSPDDRETQQVCSKYSVDCIKTSVMFDDGDKMNKGRAINLGLGHLRGLDWILHLDADIFLPHNFKNMLHRSKLNKNNLYGCDRVNVRGYDHWENHKHKAEPHYSHGYFVEPPAEFPLGARIIHQEHGYTPIGYFQLWHHSLNRRYPIHQGNAEHTDVLFACQWPREQRILLPELFVYHLESEHCEMGKNWNGRKTKRWGCCNNIPGNNHGYCGKKP